MANEKRNGVSLWEIPRKFRREHNRGQLAFRKRYKSGGGTNTVQTVSGPPAQILQNYSDVYNQAKNVASQPNQQYGGPLVAGFTPMQTAGFNNINTAVNAPAPFLNNASQYMTNAATLLDPSNFGGTVSAYQSPYTKQVVDATQQQFNNSNAIQQNQLRGNAASAGAFGGDRQAVAQAVLAGQQQAQQAPVIANLYNTGFQNATNAAQSNAWLNSQTGFGMANLGQEAETLGLAGANAQLQGGAQQQAQAQQQLNVPYQAFLAAQGYPYQTTNWLMNAALGIGGASGGTGSTTSPGPSPVSQIAGLGLSGTSLIGATGGFGANGWLTGAGGLFGGAGAAGADGAFGSAATGALIDSGVLDAAGSAAGSEAAAAALALVARGGRIGGLGRAHGGSIEDFARHLDRVPVRPRGFDIGGGVTPGLTASVGGNPAQTQLAQSYSGLPTEQLQELAARFSPSTPQGMMVQRALAQRHMNPGANAAQPTVPQGGMGPSLFADGGDVEGDDLPELNIPAPGPSVPGGLAAGFGAAPMRLRTSHPSDMHEIPGGASGGFVPPPAELAPVVLSAAQRHGVDPKPLAWLLSQESHWNPRAYNPQSGTKGIGQFKDGTAREVGIDPWEPHQAIDGAANYLRKMLDRSNGDYERAISHYGTFSTGHGAEADAAVRRQFRSFMGTQARRGGRIAGFAPGGGVEDMSGLTEPGSLSYADPASVPPDDTPSPRHVITDGFGGSIPLPPPAAPAESAAISATPSPHGPTFGGSTEDEALKPNPWEALLAAGLGIMGGRSPSPAVNIGQGGMAGLKDYQQQRQLMIQDQVRRDVAKTNAVWRAGQLGNLQDKTALANSIAQTREPLVKAQTDLATTRAQMASDAANKGKYTYQASTQTDPDDPNKTISGFTQLDPTGKEPPTFLRTDTNPNKGAAGAGGMSGREGVFFKRIVQSGNAAAAAISNIMELPTTASSGIFGGRTQGPGLFAAAKETLTNTLTSQGVQDYNSMLAGVSRNLATLESAGLAPNGSLTHSMDSLTLKEGDTEITKMRKIAEMRQIVEKNLEPSLDDPKIPDQQKEGVRKIIGAIQQTVPFTHHDITQFQASKAPTMNDFMQSKKLGGGGQQPSRPAAAPVTVPHYAVGPGGLTLHSMDGKTWLKPDGSAYAP